MSRPITRETFISEEEALKIAVQLPKMWIVDDEDDLKEVSVPAYVRKTGKLPEGYTYGRCKDLHSQAAQRVENCIASLDFHLDPSTVVVALQKAGVTDLE